MKNVFAAWCAILLMFATLASPAHATSIVVAADADNVSTDPSYGLLWNFSYAPADPFAIGTSTDPLTLTFDLSHSLKVTDYSFGFFHFSYRLIGGEFTQPVDSNQYFDLDESLTLGGVQVGTTRSSVMWGHGDTVVQLDFFDFELPPDWAGVTFDGLTIVVQNPFDLRATTLYGSIGVEPAAAVPETAPTLGLVVVALLMLFACASAARRLRPRLLAP